MKRDKELWISGIQTASISVLTMVQPQGKRYHTSIFT